MGVVEVFVYSCYSCSYFLFLSTSSITVVIDEFVMKGFQIHLSLKRLFTDGWVIFLIFYSQPLSWLCTCNMLLLINANVLYRYFA